MTDHLAPDMLRRTFRSNPHVRVVAFDRLSARDKAALGAVRKDSAYFGILVGTGDDSPGVKAVCRNTAQLIEQLRDAGPLPRSLIDGSRETANRQIAEFVLDDVLQVYHQGRFVSGAGAQAIIQARRDGLESAGRLARLSCDALRFAERLPLDDPMYLSAQLYFYNRVPITPHWMREIGDEAGYARFLGLEAGGPSSRLLTSHWNEVAYSPERAGWRAWSLRNDYGGGRSLLGGYKLYVSPVPAALGDVFPIMVETFTDEKVARFKIGTDLAGLMRPDKIVAYFDSFDHLEQAAQHLFKRLSDVPPHGVPFTAELGGEGLLSWGMDPYDKPVFQWQTSTSWRLWITNHLASALLAAHRSDTPSVVPWRFALERLQLLGVDTSSWTPTSVYDQTSHH